MSWQVWLRLSERDCLFFCLHILKAWQWKNNWVKSKFSFFFLSSKAPPHGERLQIHPHQHYRGQGLPFSEKESMNVSRFTQAQSPTSPFSLAWANHDPIIRSFNSGTYCCWRFILLKTFYICVNNCPCWRIPAFGRELHGGFIWFARRQAHQQVSWWIHWFWFYISQRMFQEALSVYCT